MRIILDKATKQVKYVVPEGADVLFENDRIEFADLVICDLNATNSELIEVESVPENATTLIFSDGFQTKGAYQLTILKNDLLEDLKRLRSEFGSLILQVQLACDPEPEGLQQLIASIREMYPEAKLEIAELTEETAPAYVLRGPKVEYAFNILNSYL